MPLIPALRKGYTRPFSQSVTLEFGVVITLGSETWVILQGMGEEEKTEAWLGPTWNPKVEAAGQGKREAEWEAVWGLPTHIPPFHSVSGFSHCTSPNAASAADCSCLHVSVTEVVKTSNLAGRSFTVSLYGLGSGDRQRVTGSW